MLESSPCAVYHCHVGFAQTDSRADASHLVAVIPVCLTAALRMGRSVVGTHARCLRILYVEDHADTRVVMERLLTGEGYAVVAADSCRAAREAATAGPFDLLIADVGLHDGDGWQLLAELQELYPLRGIVVSGYGMASDVAESVHAGFDRHLTKPIDFPSLAKTIEEVAASLPATSRMHRADRTEKA